MARDVGHQKEWLEGYGFWRGQYTARNKDFLNLKSKTEAIKKDFILIAKRCLDKHIFNLVQEGAAFSPYFNEGIRAFINNSSDVLKEKFHEFCIAERDYMLKFPYVYDKRNSEEIINSINLDNFPYFSDIKDVFDYRLYNIIHTEKCGSVRCNYYGENKDFIDLTIDKSANIVHILEQVCNFIEMECKKYDDKYVSIMDLVSICLRYSVIKRKHGIIYNAKSSGDTSRAIGLWIYDYKEENDCTQEDAVRVLASMPYFYALGLSEKDSSTFNRMYRQTKKCIHKAEVLKIQG